MSGEDFECEIMDWDLFDRLAEKVAERIIDSGFQSDFMVGLARGGWVLSRVLCDYLGIKDLVSLKVEHWGITATPDGKARLKYPFKIDLTGKKVLVVDDITDTGESLKIAVDYVKSLNPKEVRTATLRYIEGSEFMPDYYGDEITWRWVIFPWNYMEDMCNIIPKASEGADTMEEVKRRLKARHNLELDVQEINRILEEVERRKT